MSDEVFVANGEVAKVIEVADKWIVAELSNPKRVVRIPIGKSKNADKDDENAETEAASTGIQWELGYALSVHRSQGSEWPWVIVLIDEYPGARMICSREFWYTAISRAKSRCVLIGKKSVVDAGCRKVAIGKRKTFLRELIHLRTAERLLVEL